MSREKKHPKDDDVAEADSRSEATEDDRDVVVLDAEFAIGQENWLRELTRRRESPPRSR